MTCVLLWSRFRWLYVPATLLTFLLQRAPLVRTLVSVESAAGSPLSAILRSAFTVAAVGGYHALAGATQLSSNPATPASARVGQSFSMVFAVIGAPATAASYEIRGVIPPGLTIPGLSGDLLNASTVTVSGTPTAAGSYSLLVRAWNTTGKRGEGGNPTFTVQINVQAAATAPPTFTTHPANAVLGFGESATLTAAATGEGTITYQWTKDGVAITGATGASLALNSVSPAASGVYRVIATNAGGSTTSNAATVTVAAAIPPSILTQPLSQVVVLGASLTLSVEAGGSGPLTYQWRKGGVPLAGATQSTLTFASVQASDAGDYSVAVSNAGGSVISAPAVLGTTPTVTSAISNVAVRTTLAANQILIVGFNMAGGSKPVLLRAVGPGLAPFGVPGTMPDPRMTLFNGGTQLEGNDNWGGGATLSTAFASVGAFGLPPASLDAALLSSVEGGRTAQVQGSAAGTVLVEAYAVGSGTGTRLTNVSARNRVGTGGDILIAGITIDGTTPKTVLIRAIGPTLTAFGVTGFLADPKLEVFSGSTAVAQNDTWSPTLAGTFAQVGAFGLAAGGKDAAVVLSLAPGGYTVQVSGADGGTGEALVEVYEVQP